MKRTFFATALSLLLTATVNASDINNFDSNWLFLLADSSQMSEVSYNDNNWRKLNLPHDWSIEQDFSASAPAGNGGGALPGGTAWYRKHFNINDKDKSSRYFIYFDGVYKNSTVYLNGHKLGNRPYGFISFEYEMTPYINRNGENVIAVRVDNSDQPNCRWYSGSGIYRHVYIKKTAQNRIANWGVHVTPTLQESGSASVDVEITTDKKQKTKNTFVISILDKDNKTVKTIETENLKNTVLLDNPTLWSLDNPYLYTLKVSMKQGKKTVDEECVKFGVRTIRFDVETGFYLNGKPMKINGVCNHHDLGCMGAALNEDALYRQLKLLKDMGCNAIRCSHNPPAPELLNMCDSMGLLVQDEAFDMWHKKKTKYDYSQYFDKWYKKDLTDMLLRDRNHPSIIMWSIGNEVLEQWTSANADELTIEQANLILNFGHKNEGNNEADGGMSLNSQLTKHLADIVREYDTTRPVTAGCNETGTHNHLFKSGALDVISFNYHNSDVKDVPKNYPGKPFMFSESVSSIQTRGNYVMPSDSLIKAPKEWWIPYTDPSFQCSAYDNSRVSWGNTHEETWDLIKNTPYCAGEFIWTGFDYIGEPTPYGFPARSSYFGIIDLAGFPKDVYYMYQSEWTDKTVLHLFPHWNWIEGDSIDMWCYYSNADEVELYVNGKSRGIRRKGEHDYHVMWRVMFEKGEVKAISRKDGKVIAEQTIHTAGAPYKIKLTDQGINAGGPNACRFIIAEIVDKDGNLCPRADNEIRFEVDGAEILGTDNGNPISMERFKSPIRKAFNGKALLVIRPTTDNYTVKAKSPDFNGAIFQAN